MRSGISLKWIFIIADHLGQAFEARRYSISGSSNRQRVAPMMTQSSTSAKMPKERGLQVLAPYSRPLAHPHVRILILDRKGIGSFEALVWTPPTETDSSIAEGMLGTICLMSNLAIGGDIFHH